MTFYCFQCNILVILVLEDFALTLLLNKIYTQVSFKHARGIIIVILYRIIND